MSDAALQTALALYLGHLLADYVFQTDAMVAYKKDAKVIGTHIGIVALCSLATLGGSLLVVLIISVLHLLIDLAKIHLVRGGFGSYTVDQIAHLLSVLFVSSTFPLAFETGIWGQLPDFIWPWVAATCGIFLTTFAGYYGVDLALNKPHRPHRSGQLVGITERLAILVLGLEGWLIAAPVLLIIKLTANNNRLRDATTGKFTNFVRGSLVSFGWGIGATLVTLYFRNNL
ncbi:MAG: DUF3307 domain-containing protein [Pseudomonadota bacterium]|nr:DUF3307 domain-containing protein [Pseudomonadota bacterium]